MVGEYLSGGILYELLCIHALPQPQSARDYPTQYLSGSAAQCERRRQQHGFFKGLPEQLFRQTFEETMLLSPSFTLRGGTREILRGVIARGLGLR